VPHEKNRCHPASLTTSDDGAAPAGDRDIFRIVNEAGGDKGIWIAGVSGRCTQIQGIYDRICFSDSSARTILECSSQ
jgi:hypothetical protein